MEDSKVKPPNEENSKPPDLIVNAGVDDFSGGKNQDNSPVDRRGKKKKKKKAKRVTGLGRRTKEEIVKWNRMTALSFPGGGGGISGTDPTFGSPEEVVQVLELVLVVHLEERGSGSLAD